MFKNIFRRTLTVGFTLISCLCSAAENADTTAERFRVCVLDFTSADILGQKRFLDISNKPIVIPAQSTLDSSDSANMCPIMQGWVRMIDAKDNARTNEANRNAQIQDNQFNREKALELYRTIVKGPSRPMIIGADYLSGYLGQYSDVFVTSERSLVYAAMAKLQNEQDFPTDFMLKLAKSTNITHLIYGTVSDIRTSVRSFKGYGIETKTLIVELDVIVKMVDLVAQQGAYSKVYTASRRIQMPVNPNFMSNDLFQTLMQNALKQAADDFYDVCKPGRKNKVKVTPMP